MIHQSLKRSLVTALLICLTASQMAALSNDDNEHAPSILPPDFGYKGNETNLDSEYGTASESEMKWSGNFEEDLKTAIEVESSISIAENKFACYESLAERYLHFADDVIISEELSRAKVECCMKLIDAIIDRHSACSSSSALPAVTDPEVFRDMAEDLLAGIGELLEVAGYIERTTNGVTFPLQHCKSVPDEQLIALVKCIACVCMYTPFDYKVRTKWPISRLEWPVLLIGQCFQLNKYRTVIDFMGWYANIASKELGTRKSSDVHEGYTWKDLKDGKYEPGAAYLIHSYNKICEEHNTVCQVSIRAAQQLGYLTQDANKENVADIRPWESMKQGLNFGYHAMLCSGLMHACNSMGNGEWHACALKLMHRLGYLSDLIVVDVEKWNKLPSLPGLDAAALKAGLCIELINSCNNIAKFCNEPEAYTSEVIRCMQQLGYLNQGILNVKMWNDIWESEPNYHALLCSGLMCAYSSNMGGCSIALELAYRLGYLNNDFITINAEKWNAIDALARNALQEQLLVIYGGIGKEIKCGTLREQQQNLIDGRPFQLVSPQGRQGCFAQDRFELPQRPAPTKAEQRKSFEDLSQKLRAAESRMEKDGLFLDLNNRSMMVVGDLHGDIVSLEACLIQFQKFVGSIGNAEQMKRAALVFLGDYVDRGPHSIEILRTLAKLKSEFPDNVYLIRGNHEDNAASDLAVSYGLSGEINRLFPDAKQLGNSEQLKETDRQTEDESNSSTSHSGQTEDCNEIKSECIDSLIDGSSSQILNPVMAMIREFFGYLPIMAVNNDYILMHGYLPINQGKSENFPNNLKKLKDYLQDLPFPYKRLSKQEIHMPDWVEQILWNDPKLKGVSETSRGSGCYVVSAKEVRSFIKETRVEEKGSPSGKTNPAEEETSSSSKTNPAEEEEFLANETDPMTIIRGHQILEYNTFLSPMHTYNIFSSYFIWPLNASIPRVASVLKIKFDGKRHSTPEAYVLTDIDIKSAMKSCKNHFPGETEFVSWLAGSWFLDSNFMAAEKEGSGSSDSKNSLDWAEEFRNLLNVPLR